MSRYDKYDNISGGFRAPLDDDQAKITGNPIGYGLDADGHAVPGAGTTGVVGVLLVTRNMVAGDIVDIMTGGEVVEFEGDPGTVYYADPTDGEITDTPSEFPVGYTVESTRLIVRMGNSGGGGSEVGLGVVGDQDAIADLDLTTLTDSPATADALRDNLTATWEVEIQNKINAIIAALEASGLIAS